MFHSYFTMIKLYDKIRVQKGECEMEVETILAKNIRIADDKAKYDEACKRLLGEKIILA